MVKRIKNRPKKKKTQSEDQVESVSTTTEANANASAPQEAATEDVDVEVIESPLTASEKLKLEIKSNAAYTGDNFAEVTERVLLSMADHWQMILVLFVVVSSVYGFIQLNHHWAVEDHSSERVQLVKAKASYQEAQDQYTNYLKRKAKWYQDNPEALTSPNFGEAPALSIYKQSADQFSQLQEKLTSNGSRVLAQLGAAGARFDMAKESSDFQKVAQEYTNISDSTGVVPFVKALALQNAAVSYEKAAHRAAKKEAASLWEKASGSWGLLAGLDQEVFGIFATLKQAQAQVKQGKKDVAKKTLDELQRSYETQLKDPKNQKWKQEIQRSLARL